MNDSRTLFEMFRQGHRLYVQTAGETFGFNLTNSAKALAATLECTSRYVRGTPPPQASSNPFVATQRPTATGPQKPEYTTEAAIFVANVLSAANIPGFRVIPREQIPAGMQAHDAVWTADQGLVGLLNVETQYRTADQAGAALMAADAQNCKGAFASGRYPTEPHTGNARLMTACTDTERPVQVNYVIASRPKGGFYVFAVIGGAGEAQLVQDASVKLNAAALKSLGTR